MDDEELNNIHDMAKTGEQRTGSKETQDDKKYFSLDLSEFDIVESEYVVFIDLKQNFKSGILQFDYELDDAELGLFAVGCMMEFSKVNFRSCSRPRLGFSFLNYAWSDGPSTAPEAKEFDLIYTFMNIRVDTGRHWILLRVNKMERCIHFTDMNNSNPGIALKEIQHFLVYIGELTMSEAEQVDEDGFIGPKNNCYEVVCDIMPTLTDNKDNACGIYTFMAFYNNVLEYVQYYKENVPKDSLFQMPEFEYDSNVREKAFEYWLKAAFVVRSHLQNQK